MMVILRMALAVLIGALGGFAAQWLGFPLPFMMGAFLASTAATISGVSVFGVSPVLPMPVRNLFVAVIGVMIGGSFHPGIFATLQNLIVPMAGVVLFVAGAWAMNFFLFQRVGRYDRQTAFFAAMPGGLIESIAFGERAGADIATLTMQQFARISLVIMTVPFLLMWWTGQPLGSAAGVTIAGLKPSPDLQDWLILGACALIGLYGGRALRLPAALLVGPLILSAACHFFGLTEAGPPVWLVATAQVFVGTGLGSRFRGFQPRQIARVAGLALLSVALMLGFGIALVLGLSQLVDLPLEVLMISYAPGGVTEMGLIALSLHANPVFVTTLHVFRIMLTVVVSSLGYRLMSRKTC